MEIRLETKFLEQKSHYYHVSRLTYLSPPDPSQLQALDPDGVGVDDPGPAGLSRKACDVDVLQVQVGDAHGLLIEAGGGGKVGCIATAAYYRGVYGAVEEVVRHRPLARRARSEMSRIGIR